MPDNMFLSVGTVYSMIKDILHELTGLPRAKIQHTDDLRSKYHMTEGAVRGLAKHINDRFAPYGISVTPSECGACRTVRDLVRLVRSKLRQKTKENSA